MRTINIRKKRAMMKGDKRMMKKRGQLSKAIAAVVSAAMLLQVTGCGTGEKQPVEPARTSGSGLEAEAGKMVNLSDQMNAEQRELVDLSTIDSRLIDAISDSSMRMFYENMKQKPAENVLISPASILFAFGMTENGADGNTLSEMEQVVNGGLSIQELNVIMHAMNKHLSEAEDVDWNVADSIWVKNDGSISLQEPFVLDAVSYYDADIVMAPFDDSTVMDINAWVNDNTNGMIPSLINTITPDIRMYLINAMAFEGEWEEEYEEHQVHEDWEFTNADGTKSQVTMLSSEESGYFRLGDGIGFRKNYKGGQYSFVGILPPEDMTVEEYMAEILKDKNGFAKAVKDMKSDVPVYVQIPEFTLDYDVEMSGLLADMGMPTAFTENADFTGMVTEGSDPLYIGQVIHKTHIEVDRQGTKAAAATAITMQTNGILIDAPEPVFIYLDRPFIYGIIDNDTGLPIFIGCTNKME